MEIKTKEKIESGRLENFWDIEGRIIKATTSTARDFLITFEGGKWIHICGTPGYDNNDHFIGIANSATIRQSYTLLLSANIITKEEYEILKKADIEWHKESLKRSDLANYKRIKKQYNLD